MQGRKRERRPIAGAGAEKSTWLGAQLQYNAWNRWAHQVHVDRFTARQAVAVQLVQAGIAPTPEAALAMLEVSEGAA